MADSLIVGVFLGLCSNSVVAQQLEEIVVTAQKRSESAQDVGISINAFTAEQLRDFNLNTGKDIVNLVSGVLVNDNFGATPAYVIRGIGLNDFETISAPSVAVYVDGVYQAFSESGAPQIFDLERVEILKGPQGTLYGRNASSGAINFITKRPTEEFEGYVEAGFGEFSRVELEAAVGGPINSDWSYRLSGKYLTHDAALETRSPDPVNFPTGADEALAPDDAAFRGQLLYSPGTATDVLIQAHYATQQGTAGMPFAIATGQDPNSTAVCPGRDGAPDADRSGCRSGFNGGTEFGGGFYVPLTEDFVTSSNFIEPFDNDYYGLTVQIDHDFAAATLTSQTSYDAWEYFHNFDEDALSIEALNIQQDREFSQIAQELRLAGNSDSVDWLLGVYGSSDNYKQDQWTYCGTLTGNTGSCRYVGAPGRLGSADAAFLPVANTLFGGIDQDTVTFAVFTDNKIQITDRVELVAGYRYTYEDRDFVGNGLVFLNDGSARPANQFDAGEARGERELVTKRSSGRVGINFALSDSVLLYTSLSEGFKSGGFDGSVASNAPQFLTPTVEEVVRSFEVGFKSDPQDNLRVNGALFVTEYEDPQARLRQETVAADGQTIIPQVVLANLEDADIFGAELELLWIPVEGLSINGTLSFLDTEISETGIAADLFDGNELAFAPQFSGTLAIAYDWDIGASLVGRLGANAKFVGDHFLRPENFAIDEEDYTVVDARFGIGDSNNVWFVNAWVKNLTDEQYRTNAVGSFGADPFQIALPLTWGVNLTYNF